MSPRVVGVLARSGWPDVLATATGDRGAGPYLDNRDDVARVGCTDLASGRDIDEP
jgi:molybdenum cofactor cytidylyltransferase